MHLDAKIKDQEPNLKIQHHKEFNPECCNNRHPDPKIKGKTTKNHEMKQPHFSKQMVHQEHFSIMNHEIKQKKTDINRQNPLSTYPPWVTATMVSEKRIGGSVNLDGGDGESSGEGGNRSEREEDKNGGRGKCELAINSPIYRKPTQTNPKNTVNLPLTRASLIGFPATRVQTPHPNTCFNPNNHHNSKPWIFDCRATHSMTFDSRDICLINPLPILKLNLQPVIVFMWMVKARLLFLRLFN